MPCCDFAPGKIRTVRSQKGISMELYLITGFLGAGKTTFLREFSRLFPGKRLQLIINEFGKTGVDGTLLQDLHAEMSEITNGSIFCACRLDKFEEALRRCVESRPDVILVEASGLADPTNVQAVLEQPAFAPVRYCGSVCLVDTPRLASILRTARVCPRQLKVSSLILLNKTDLATDAQMDFAHTAIRAYNPEAVIRHTQFGRLEPAWMQEIHPLTGETAAVAPDIRLQKQLVELDPQMTIAQLSGAVRMIAEDAWRIKGFSFLEGRHLLVDCVGPSVRICTTALTAKEENCLVLLAGPGMPLRHTLKQAIRWYPGLLREVWE